ncbi:MAG: hypothetical protein OXC07_07775 [Kistimonas sp.]|nr:hypothetical protein [Kistimonas sp.]
MQGPDSITSGKPQTSGVQPPASAQRQMAAAFSHAVATCEPGTVQPQISGLAADRADSRNHQELARAAALLMEQRRIDCSHFVIPHSDVVVCGTEPVEGLTQSPDGCWLALWCRSANRQPSIHVTLLHKQGTALRRGPSFRHPDPLVGLNFSRDSRHLRAVDHTGQIQTWQRQPGPAGDLWLGLGVDTPCQWVSNRISLNNDGSRMAVSCGGIVTLLRETQPGVWQPEALWPWRNSDQLPAELWYCMEPPARFMFNQESNHLLRIDSQGVELCHRQAGGCWQAQPIHLNPPILSGRMAAGQPSIRFSDVMGLTLDAAGDWLAMALWQDVLTPPHHGWVALEVWQFDCAHGWLPAQIQPIPVSALREPRIFPMVFSPDRQELAYAEFDVTASYTDILSRLPSGDWAVTHKLQFHTPSAHRATQDRLIESLQFSPTGRYLAVVSAAGIQIWQRDPSRDWIVSAWIENGWPGKCQAVFSPDGAHCAMVVGSTGYVVVCGPVGTGPNSNYRVKASWLEHGPVSQIQFTSDGGCLLITSQASNQPNAGTSHLRYLSLEPEARNSAA